MDLFASVEKHARDSLRVHMFARFINNDFSHSRAAAPASHTLLSGGAASRQSFYRGGGGADSHRRRPSTLTGVGIGPAMVSGSHQLTVVTEKEDQARRSRHWRQKVTLGLSRGARELTTRILDFYISFIQFVRRFTSGPFGPVADNNEGGFAVATALCFLVPMSPSAALQASAG
jgi:hypothetical protein